MSDATAPCVTPTDSDADGEGGARNGNANAGLGRLIKNTNNETTEPYLLNLATVPRVDLNAYLQSEMAVRPPCELGMTLVGSRWG